MAHEWCSGSKYNSWEDWLNETTAEWSALLYALHIDNAALFDFIINKNLSLYDSLPPIKTIDGSRPDGVHSKGTVLFYRIYLRYGAYVVRKLVQIFAALSEKTTSEFIHAVRKKVSLDVAAFIENGIL